MAHNWPGAGRKADTAKASAFTLVEALIVIAILGILAALGVAAFSNSAEDTRRVLARQQQAEVQGAVNAWVVTNSSQPGTSLSSARTAYNNASTSLARLQLVGGYLDSSSLSHLTSNTTDASKVQSDALKKLGQHLELSDWAAGSYPMVELK